MRFFRKIEFAWMYGVVASNPKSVERFLYKRVETLLD